MKLLSLIISLLKAKERKPKFQSDLSTKINISNFQQKEIVFSNRFTVQSPYPQAQFLFNSILSNEGRFGKQDKLVALIIKYEIVIEEVESYIGQNRKRYLDRIDTLYNGQIHFSKLSTYQKEEILKGFRATPYITAYCHLDFLSAQRKEEMIHVFEYKQYDLVNYSWLIDALGGFEKFKYNWYLMKMIQNSQKSFVPHDYMDIELIKEFQKYNYLEIVDNPSIESLIEVMPFKNTRQRLLENGHKISSREMAITTVRKNGLFNTIFSNEDYKLIKGIFIEPNKRFLSLADAFDKILEYTFFIANKI